MGDVAKAMGEEWKALSAEGKAPYEERARVDKVRGRGRGGSKGQRVPASLLPRTALRSHTRPL